MNPLWRLLRLFRPYSGWMLAGTGLTLIVTLSNVGLLALSGWFIASMALSGLGNQMFDYFTPAAAIRGLALLRTGGRYLERLVTHEATFRLLSELRVWFYQRLEPLAPARLQYYRGGDLLSRIRADIDTLDNFYLRVIAPTVAAMISIILMTGFLCFFDVRIALTDLTALILAGIALPFLTQRLGRMPGNQAVTLRARLRTEIADAVRGMGELQVYGAATLHAQNIEALNHALIKPQRHQAHINDLSNTVSGLAMQLCLWVTLVLAIPLLSHNRLPKPDLAMMALFIMASFEAINTLPLAFQTLGETLAAAGRIFEIVDMQPAVSDPTDETTNPQHFDLCFQQVCMQYAEGQDWSLDHVDLVVPEGQHLGIVGATGSGKTSLFNVLLRFWDYQAGEIKIGGISVRTLKSETVRRLCSVISQQTHLFNTSIRENLLLGRPDANDAELLESLRMAHVLDDVLNLPQGLDTFTGETGSRLSSGQARRIVIARAMLKNTPILLLDEPTEGLDAHSEHAVLTALESLMQGRTSILISHRPQALSYVDDIAIMASGQIIKQGSRDEMLQNEAYFAAYTKWTPLLE